LSRYWTVAYCNRQERGAFEALQKNVLRAMQLNIFENADKPQDVVEAYTFTFSYSQCGAVNGATLASVELKGPRGETMTVRNARHALNMFVRQLITLCQTMPQLPGESKGAISNDLS